MYGGRNHYNNHSNQPHHHHYPSNQHKGPPPGEILSPESAQAAEIFDKFISAATFKSVLHYYQQMCDVLRLRPTNIRHFYPKLKSKIRSWKAQALWTKFDKRASHKCYNHGKICNETKVLIIGSGPCGLRAAIEAQLLGAKVVVVEKRDRFSRNNVLHLWPFVIADLKALGAKKFYGKFCAGAIDHISIRQLQCILIKVALLLGVEVFEGVTFEELLEPPEDQGQKIGFYARFSPAGHPVNQYEFDVLIGADGKRNTLMGFKRKEFRGKLAIAITANFINKKTEQEASVQEISGVAFIFNQKFFKDLHAETGIDLENIVYYKDETHYFVMTAKKHSLINKGVIIRDLADTRELLHPNNVDRKALCQYAREAADFSTGYQMPHLDFAVNHYGKPDIAMFDFTSMFAAENACRVIECRGHKLLQCLVGDSLLEPFWPTGSGCARGFLSSFDACWAIRSWASNKMYPLEVIAERESIYRLLNQTTPENLAKDFSAYTLEPPTRYPTVNMKILLPFQVGHLFATDEVGSHGDGELLRSLSADDIPRKRKRADSLIQPETLLAWCQKQVAQHPQVEVQDFEKSFNDGLVFCAIIHRYRPDLIDFESLKQNDKVLNNQLALNILEREYAILPIISAEDLSSELGNKEILVSFISQIHDAFRGEITRSMGQKPSLHEIQAKSTDNLDLGDFPMESTNVSCKLSCKVLREPNLVVATDDSSQLIKKRRNESKNLESKSNEKMSMYHRSESTSDEFSNKIKGLEAKFKTGTPSSGSQHKPKEMIRAIGKIEKTDWNLSAIERKIEDNPKAIMGKSDREKVPRWTKNNYNDKFHSIERRLRENGEDEERIAKYVDIDASLNRLERKLREGSTLETGLRGHNKVSNLASQLSSKWSRNEEENTKVVSNTPKQSRPMILPSNDSDLCYFCGTRVYLVERRSAEGKFFHRQCFKCSYCGALLRLGHYIYDRENRYGGKFFCVPHFGLTVRSRTKKPEEISVVTDRRKLMNKTPATSYYGRSTTDAATEGGRAAAKSLLNKSFSPNSKSLLGTPKNSSSLASIMDDRGTTPERVEFENSLIEHSDEEEYLSEDEWTDRNFGASANELDEDDDDSDYSDLSDEELAEEVLESAHQLTAEETRRLAESWKRRYSNNEFDIRASLSESDEILSEEHDGADGDESHTATEGEMGEDDDEDDNERVKKAREIRRRELDINVDAPPRKAETSDSGSDTEVASEEESDTQIDTDSEFAEDINETRPTPKDIPMIVIDEIPKESVEVEPISKEETDEGETSPSLTQSVKPNPFTEQLKRLLHRTESTEAVTANRSKLKRNYLLGDTNYSPKKSASSADIGDRFKSFMDKISETQKKLNPAPEPSPAMQAFLNSSNNILSSPPYDRDILSTEVFSPISQSEELEKSGMKSPPSSSESTSKSEEGKLFSFSVKSEERSPISSIIVSPTKNEDSSFNDFEKITESNGENLQCDAMNVSLIDSIEKKEIICLDNVINTSEESITNLHNDAGVLNLNESSLDFEIIANNLKNVADNCEPETEEASPIADIDECFDQLADDALLDIDASDKILISSQEFASEETTPKVMSENIDDNCNLKSDIIVEEHNSTTKLDESGFKSMDDNKTTSSYNQEENSESLKEDQSSITPVEKLSPEVIGLTEGDLSDWADDHEIFTGEDLKDDIGMSIENDPPVLRARIASLESLGDSDSAISIGLPKETQQETNTSTKSLVYKESENMDYVDTSESESSHDDDNPFSYDKLQEDIIITTSTPTDPKNKNNSIDNAKRSFNKKSNSVDTEDIVKNDLHILRSSFSDSHCEKTLNNEAKQHNSTPKRYEGYIPRFKDRRTPFSLARDSIDVRKQSTTKPLFTPSKEDILQRQKNENERMAAFNSSLSPVTETKKMASKPRDGDLVKDMVMSRMVRRRSPDKINRRGSRNLSFDSSSSSLFGSEISLSKDSSAFIKTIDAEMNKSIKESEVSNDSSPLMNNSGGHTIPHSVPLSPNSVPSTKTELSSSPRTVLPATPLTHPERFRPKNHLNKKELFKSTPHLPSVASPPPELPARVPYISTDHLNAATQTPPIVKLQMNSGRDHNRAQSESPLPPQRRIAEPEMKVVAKEAKKDPEERLKELLAERKRRETEEQRKEVRLRTKNSCLKECLEEYRLKRNSAPVPQEMIFAQKKRQQPDVTNHNRPTRLDIERVQVFSKTSGSPSLLDPLVEQQRDRSSSFSSTPSYQMQSKPLVMEAPSSFSPTQLSYTPMPSASNNPVSPSSLQSPPLRSYEAVAIKRPIKKSKDRERRRSLIQVFAGMFNKSEDKKKCEDVETNLNASFGSNSGASGSPSPTQVVSPKSPSVKERFSKLRLSRSKKKNQVDDKNRSVSVDEAKYLSVEATSPANSLSLPTSPSRTIFSFLASSPSNKIEKRKQSASEEDDFPQMKHSDSLPSNATPSTRRQKAKVIRAAKQVEQKRLRMAQEIQRQLEECEVKTRELEDRGIKLEKKIIEETKKSQRDEPELMKDWFRLVHEKNALVRWQEELLIKAKELELDDRHVRLENELRHRMTCSESEKTREDIDREGRLLAEIISVIDQKDSLTNLLEEDRQRYIEEDKDLEEVHARKILERNPFQRETGV